MMNRPGDARNPCAPPSWNWLRFQVVGNGRPKTKVSHTRAAMLDFPAMDGIKVIETEWGSELHRRLIAQEHAERVAWRNSPEAWEQARRMKEAGPLRIDWSTAIVRKPITKKVPIYQWSGLSH
jgi:hypothetical protein